MAVDELAALDEEYGRPGSKAARIRQLVAELLLSKDSDGQIPTNGRFIFYELEQRGDATKPSPDDLRPNKRRSRGWPPGGQDVTDALTWLREQGIVPWEWIEDETRQLIRWSHAPSVHAYMLDRLREATVNPWAGPPPLILCESRATAGVLAHAVSPYCCPIAGTAGQAAGFLHVEIAPLLAVERPVLSIVDLDKAGGDIEGNTRRVLERVTGKPLDWRRLAMTAEQAQGIEPIYKQDGRTKQWHEAWEVESLGQARLVALVCAALDELLPQSLARVQERANAERVAHRRYLADFNGGAP
jgi:hypothetical protein